MKNKIIFLALITLSSVTLALTSEEKIAQEHENIKLLAQMGLPLPGFGIQIVPRSSLNLSAEEIQNGDREMDEFRTKGYINKYISRPQELLSMNQTYLKEFN